MLKTGFVLVSLFVFTFGAGTAHAAGAPRAGGAPTRTWRSTLKQLDRRDAPQRKGAGEVVLATTPRGAAISERAPERVVQTLRWERYRKYPPLSVRSESYTSGPVSSPVYRNPVQRVAFNRAYDYLKARGYEHAGAVPFIDMAEVRTRHGDGPGRAVARKVFSLVGPGYDGRFQRASSHEEVARKFAATPPGEAVGKWLAATAR